MLDQQQPSLTSQPELDSVLANFKPRPPIIAEATSSTTGLDTNEQSQKYQESSESTEAEVTESTEAETNEVLTSPEFTTQFKEAFGLEPAEALDTVNALVAFRDEVRLMSEWELAPTQYRQRMEQVKEFYNTLPEEGQAQFNTVEGAISIWNHISNSQPQTRQNTVKPASKLATSKPKADIIKKSDVLRMDSKTYAQNAARIQKAVLEGRFLEDA